MRLQSFRCAWLASLVCVCPATSRAQITHHVNVDSNGIALDSGSVPAITANGRFVAWAGNPNVYVRDRWQGTAAIASVTVSGTSPSYACVSPSISNDGRFVAFESFSPNLVSGDTNGVRDIFVRDMLNGTTEIASLGLGGALANSDCVWPSMSADGRYVLFVSNATNLVSGPSGRAYLRDRTNGTTTMVYPQSAGSPISISLSGNGRYLLLCTTDNGLVNPDNNGASDILVRDLQVGTYQIVSRGIGGAQSNGGSGAPAISSDGRFVAFESYATNLVAGDTNGARDVFVRDRQTGTTLLASANNVGAQNPVYDPGSCSISRDGRYVTFVWNNQLYRFDRIALTEVLVSVNTAGVVGDGSSSQASLGDNGDFIAFNTAAHNMLPLVSFGGLFVRDFTVSCPMPQLYCTTKVNSYNCTPTMWADGVPSLSNFNDFYVAAFGLVHQTNGLLFYGSAQAATPFFGGTLCVQPPVARLPVQNTGGGPPSFPGACNGQYLLHFDHTFMAAHNITAGTMLCMQFWGRDPGFAAPNNVQLTDGLQFTTCP